MDILKIVVLNNSGNVGKILLNFKDIFNAFFKNG